MSEYQYYEFQAIDRPLDAGAQKALRSMSSRARITAASFTNHYEWGDLRGDPRALMEQWFDLHLYLSNWGSRRLMIRVPERLINHAEIVPFLGGIEWVNVWAFGENVIFDICRDEMEPEDDWDDGSGWLAALVPLRADLLSGDFRLFYLLWLTAVEDELIADSDVEPLSGVGPLTGALEDFARFFGINPDLVQAAAEQDADTAITSSEVRERLAALSDGERLDLLLRVVEGDPHVAAEMKSRLRKTHPESATRRTVGALRQRALEIARARESAATARKEAERRRQAEEAEKERDARLKALKQRGQGVWREIDAEIERRNPSGYDRAASLLADLLVLALAEGSQADFRRRLASIRAQHEAKRKFIERLDRLEPDDGGRNA